MINGFTEKEAKKYTELQGAQLTYDNIVSITGKNSLLLSLLHKTESFAAKVRQEVSDFLSKNLKFKGKVIKKLLLHSQLKTCLSLLYYAQ